MMADRDWIQSFSDIIGLVAAALVIIFCVWLGIWRGLFRALLQPETHTVEDVIPDNFRGIFTISEDRVSGIPPRVIKEPQGTVFQYVVPLDGNLITKDEALMQS